MLQIIYKTIPCFLSLSYKKIITLLYIRILMYKLIILFYFINQVNRSIKSFWCFKVYSSSPDLFTSRFHLFLEHI